MPFEITRTDYIKVFANGEYLSQHINVEEAYESALNNGPGDYVIVYPERTFHIPGAQPSVRRDPDIEYQITALDGLFTNDVGVSVGDTCKIWVLTGSIGNALTNGHFEDVEAGTVIEYQVENSNIGTARFIEE